MILVTLFINLINVGNIHSPIVKIPQTQEVIKILEKRFFHGANVESMSISL